MSMSVLKHSRSSLFIKGILCVMLCISGSSRADQGDLKCIAEAIHREAIGEPEKGKIAIAWVILNRIKSNIFPDSACDVVTQKGQFPWATRKMKLIHGDESVTIALEVMDGKHPDPTNGSLYFQTVRHFGNHRMVTKIGNHYFFSQNKNKQ